MIFYYHLTMTAQELSNMVFSIKDKITDKEFKDLMDKLSVKNEEEKDTYEFKYVKTKYELAQIGCECCCDEIGYKFTQKIKTKKVKLTTNKRWCRIEPIMRDIKNDMGHLYKFSLEEEDNEYYLELEKKDECGDFSMLQNPKLKDKEMENTNVFITYNNILAISLKKI